MPGYLAELPAVIPAPAATRRSHGRHGRNHHAMTTTAPEGGQLVACSNPDGSGVCVHRPSCYNAKPLTDGRTSWPRWAVTEADLAAHSEWDRCQRNGCKP
jgi:hypothetical protein